MQKNDTAPIPVSFACSHLERAEPPFNANEEAPATLLVEFQDSSNLNEARSWLCCNCQGVTYAPKEFGAPSFCSRCGYKVWLCELEEVKHRDS